MTMPTNKVKIQLKLNLTLIYLKDTFNCMSDLSVSMKVKNINTLKISEVLNAFKEKYIPGVENLKNTMR